MSQSEAPPSSVLEPALAPDRPPALAPTVPPAPSLPRSARRLPWLALLGITVVGGFLLGMLLSAITSPLRAVSSASGGAAVGAPPFPPDMPPPPGDFILMPPPGAPPPGLPPPGPPPGR